MSLPYRRVLIVSHVYSPGPPHELESYLLDKVEDLYFIAHPLDFVKGKPSIYRYHHKGKLVYEKQGRVWPLPSLLTYVKDILANLFWGLFLLPKLDLIVALDNLNATSSLWLRTLSRTKQVVYYTIDYIPQRFGNRWLNNFYHALDLNGVRQADWVWNLSPRMTKMRQQKGLSESYTKKQLTVPIGTHILPIANVKKDPHLLVFMGHLRPGQGADLLLQAMPKIIAKNPTIRLRLIGGGPLLEALKAQAKDLKIDKAVEFTGFVPTNEEMRSLLLQGTVAVAPYVDDQTTYTRYTDPGKPKEYLAAGLPVIITKVPAFAEIIDQRQAGKAIDYNADQLAAAALELLTSPKLGQFKENAQLLAAESTWEMVFDQAFKKMGAL